MGLILDDACAFVRYILSQPEHKVWSELAFGGTHGCFEKPSSQKDPTANIDCPDITPLMFTDNQTNREAMNNESRLIHPDTGSSLTKYVLGTRLQMRKGKTSHKLKTCEYHDANLAVQGKLLKTMTQEAMQVVACLINLSKFIFAQVCRKFRTIQQDRMRSFETGFLANYIQDYSHNSKKLKVITII